MKINASEIETKNTKAVIIDSDDLIAMLTKKLNIEKDKQDKTGRSVNKTTIELYLVDSNEPTLNSTCVEFDRFDGKVIKAIIEETRVETK